MTISSTVNRADYVGNGAVNTYSYGFKILANTHIIVTVRDTDNIETTLVLTTDYTVTGVNAAAGGTIVLVSSGQSWLTGGNLKTGYALTIRRMVPLTQPTDIRNQGSFLAETHEDQFDRMVMQLQGQTVDSDRALRLPETEVPTAAAVTLPVAATRASKFLAFDASGNPIAAAGVTDAPVSAFMETVLDDTTAAAARTTLGVPSNAEAILDTIIDAKGDLIVGTAADTPARLAVGTDGHVLTADSSQAAGVKWASGFNPSFFMINGTLVATVASNALTVAIKTLAGADPSASDPVKVVFRNVTAATGDYAVISLTAATSFVMSSGSTGGFTSATAGRLWVVGFNDGGTFRLGVINCLTSALNIYPLAGFGIASSTAEGGAGGADTAHVFYTGTAVTSKAYAVLGYLSWESGLTTAGTWDAVPTRAQLFGHGVPLPGVAIQIQRVDDGAVASGTTAVVDDDSIPQNTEGDQYMSQAITPSSAANLLAIESQGHWLSDSSVAMIAAAFKDSVADAIKAIRDFEAGAATPAPMFLSARILAGGTSAVTIKIRAGGTSGTTVFNGIVAGTARRLGGAMNSYLQIMEIQA